MRYFFVTGRSPELSREELDSVLITYGYEKYTLSLRDGYLFLDIKEEKEKIGEIFNRLGGFLSYGVIYEDVDKILNEAVENKSGKITFGVSIYTDNPKKYNKQKILTLLDGIKEQLSGVNINSRYVLPNGLQLDTGQVKRSKMLDRGFELTIFEQKDQIVYGKTLEIQDIDLYSYIEFKKPYTNKDMGVLPAKLAKIMINLAKVRLGGTIWDPFCGSGTTLMMAMLNGYNALGSDIDMNAVNGSSENIMWLAENKSLSDVKFQTFHLDISKPDWKVTSLIKKTEVEAIVCEPYMGPPQFKILTEGRAKSLLKMIEELYKSLFEVIGETKKRTSTIVMVVPSYKTYKGWLSVSLNSIISKNWKIEKINEGGDLHWKRSNSIIKRNIFIVKSKSS